MRAFIDRIDETYADDPDGRLAWQDENPVEAGAYLQAKAFFAGEAGKSSQQIVNEAASSNARAATQWNRLTDLPEQQTALAKLRDGGRYSVPNVENAEAALELMSADVDRLLREGLTAATKTEDTPSTRKRRAEGRRRVPKPAAESGGGANQRPKDDISEVNDVRELLALGAEADRRSLAS